MVLHWGHLVTIIMVKWGNATFYFCMHNKQTIVMSPLPTPLVGWYKPPETYGLVHWPSRFQRDWDWENKTIGYWLTESKTSWVPGEKSCKDLTGQCRCTSTSKAVLWNLRSLNYENGANQYNGCGVTESAKSSRTNGHTDGRRLFHRLSYVPSGRLGCKIRLTSDLVIMHFIINKSYYPLSLYHGNYICGNVKFVFAPQSI